MRDFNEGCLVCLFIYLGVPIIFLLFSFAEESSFFNYLHVILFIALVVAMVVAYIKNEEYKKEYGEKMWLKKELGKETAARTIAEREAAKQKANATVANITAETQKKRLERELIEEKNKWFAQKHDEMMRERIRQNEEHTKRMKELAVKEKLHSELMKNMLFKRSATMYADYKVSELDAVETYLRTKKSPMREGSSTAEVLKRLRQEKREDVARYKEMLYKWEFLLNVFPELGKYVDDDQELLDLADYEDVDDFQQNYDRVKDYVSDEEYRNLSADERNQRALDNWRRRRKPSSAVAGMEYELYCAYLLREEGFNVIEHGVLNGRKDQGIDLIAQKPGITYIIQCKRYSTAFVHENTVCQLFGTTLNYTLANKEDWDKTLFGHTDDVIPILMTTGALSDMANEYARRLGVVIRQEKMGIFPIIKCNINNGNKIYHLPFDQQYKRTIIEPEKGEFYAMTVKEATSAGFRRAFRYNLHANGNN